MEEKFDDRNRTIINICTRYDNNQLCIWIVSCVLNIGDILVDKWSGKHKFRRIRQKKKKSYKVIFEDVRLKLNDYNYIMFQFKNLFISIIIS